MVLKHLNTHQVRSIYFFQYSTLISGDPELQNIPQRERKVEFLKVSSVLPELQPIVNYLKQGDGEPFRAVPD